MITGTAGVDRTIEDGYAAARACALTQLAVLQRELGSLDPVAEVLTVNGYVNAAPGFADSPAVINGASDLLVQVFGEAGRHVRAAVGVSALPRNALVEVANDGAGERAMSEHTLSAEPTHSVWDRSLQPRLRIEPGDEVQIECVDASGGQVRPGMTTAEYLRIDRTRIHALTGPIWIEGAEPGDVLQIDVLATRHAAGAGPAWWKAWAF